MKVTSENIGELIDSVQRKLNAQIKEERKRGKKPYIHITERGCETVFLTEKEFKRLTP